MIHLKFDFKLAKTPKGTHAILVRVYEDQALSMKCMFAWLACFRKAGKVLLTTPVAEDWRPPSVTKTLRNVIDIDDIPNIQRNVTRLLNSIPKEDFLQSYQDMYSRSKLWIGMRDDYFEGQ
ncbi:hypothetical protein TNCV_2418951 [Trichonephila clavipes]|nr:hypothetical protein TNCV_2418951 [Trichonephila clavipes]